jgi:hypothetical protein
MHMEMDEKTVLSPSGLFNSEQLYSPHVLWFKINLRFQAFFGQGPNTRGKGGCLKHRPVTSISKLTRLDIQHNEHWPSEGR